MKRHLLTCALAALVIISCSETPIDSEGSPELKKSAGPTKLITQPTTRHNAVLVSHDEIDEEDYDDIIGYGEDVALIVAEADSDFDNATIKNNQQIETAASDSISILASGISKLTQRVSYDITLSEVNGYNAYEYDVATGMRTQRIRYNSPGVDLIWFNGDDSVRDYSVYNALVGTVQTLMIRYNGPGADLVWFTEDDDVQRYQTELLAADGTTVGTARYNSPGIDLLWFTADDDIQFAASEMTTADGTQHWFQYLDAGIDMDWSTLEDNTVGHFSASIPNVDGLNTKHIFYIDPGLDLIPFTDDDNTMYHHGYTYNPLNLRTNSVRYNSSGLDTIWLTADDGISACEENSFNVENVKTQEITTTVGTDNLCFTGDDLITEYDAYVYDDTGHLINRNRFGDAGADTIWFTTDDIVSREYTYTIQ